MLPQFVGMPSVVQVEPLAIQPANALEVLDVVALTRSVLVFTTSDLIILICCNQRSLEVIPMYNLPVYPGLFNL